MFLTVQALRSPHHGDATRRLVLRSTDALRATGILDIPPLVSVDDDRDSLVLVGFAGRPDADADRVKLARVDLAKTVAALGAGADEVEGYAERLVAGATSDSHYYRLAICDTESRALREFADRSAGMPAAPTDLALLWIGRRDGSETSLVLTGYPDDSSFHTGSAIEDVAGDTRRELGVRVYAGEHDRGVMTRSVA